MLVLETRESAARRKAKARAGVISVSSIGMFPPNLAKQGCGVLLGDCSDVTKIGLSGTCLETPALMGMLPESDRISIAPVVGQALAMGATSIACLVAALGDHERGLHLAASPEGPYFAIRLCGGASA